VKVSADLKDLNKKIDACLDANQINLKRLHMLVSEYGKVKFHLRAIIFALNQANKRAEKDLTKFIFSILLKYELLFFSVKNHSPQPFIP
jgi:hypothetical protein